MQPDGNVIMFDVCEHKVLFALGVGRRGHGLAGLTLEPNGTVLLRFGSGSGRAHGIPLLVPSKPSRVAALRVGDDAHVALVGEAGAVLQRFSGGERGAVAARAAAERAVFALASGGGGCERNATPGCASHASTHTYAHIHALLHSSDPSRCRNTHVLKGENEKEPDVHVCLDSIPPTGCVVYSIGIANNWIFDDFMASKGCSVFSFDPSMTGAKKHQRHANHSFEPVGIGTFDGMHTGESTLYGGNSYYPVETLSRIMERHGHTHLTVVRMDVETAEWDVLEQWIARNWFEQIDQLLLEIHMMKRQDETRHSQILHSIPMEIFHSMRNKYDGRGKVGFDGNVLHGDLTRIHETGWVRPGASNRNSVGQSRFLPPELADLMLVPAAASVTSEPASEPWDAQTPFAAPGLEREACNWVHVTHYEVLGVVPYEQCVRHGADLLSAHVAKHGHWKDCDILARLWRNASAAAAADDDGVFVDAGANIGSCSLLMLGLGATTIAFEPLPINLFYFTTSVLASPPAVRARLRLYPTALGNTTGRVRMFSDPRNRGNSAVGQAIGDTDARERMMVRHAFPAREAAAVRGSMQVEFNASLATLDDTLWPRGAKLPPPPIRLLKADVQGFEPQLFAGARRLIRAGLVPLIKFELARRWILRQNGANAIDRLIRQMHEYGYNLFLEDGRRFDRPEDKGTLVEAFKHHSDNVDVIARWERHVDEGSLVAAWEATSTGVEMANKRQPT
jgi:FkbM family methyltransferase